ncbi:ABC-type transport system, substrate-binding protein [Lentzea waywayandensis]|uniref:ABC-type transport system, substrate-binding protein n=1 Tax=Lentzea waywayandensis TaxID=84724 RepID=A0A1I6FAC3_9PSEU|nr:ABC transporter family substrate-binding protein [Lentzea waywayandensis]SFR26870.1 ABC-type transport system, substrate-binding protein [Lentzea waywayandensis]
MRRLGGVLAAAVLCGTAAACTNAPPPPLVAKSEAPVITTTGPKVTEIVVGVDDVAGGYNPHALAAQSPITTALSSLLLPSPFRPGNDGAPQLDRNLMVSAKVTKAEPFTVTYTIRKDASWSDSAPIAAEDFYYLWQRMRTEPGVVDPAGYRLINNISAREGGKVVEVVFGKPFPGWRSLFSNLLPAHLLKDAPGTWSNVLSTGFPATAGPFQVRSLDEPRGEVVLERSDRYWEVPTTLDRVVIRRATHSAMAESLSKGDNQAALLRADAADVNLLKGIQNVATKPVPRNEVVQVLLRPASEQLKDVKTRRAIVAALDREALIASGTQSGPSAPFRADSYVVPPSRAGYVKTITANTLDAAVSDQSLTEAGYVKTGTEWQKAGKALKLRIAAPEKVEPYVGIANRIKAQLKDRGIDSEVVTPAAEDLFSKQLTEKDIDIAVVPRVDAGDSAAALASEYGCAGDAPDGATPSPQNIAGFCDPAIQADIDAALNGKTLVSDVLARVEPLIAAQAVSVPLFQIVDLLGVLPATVSGVDTGAPLAGVLSGAPEWRRLDK